MTEEERRLELEEMCRVLGRKIGAGLPKGVGFALVIYDFGEGGSMAYMANAKRDDMIKMFKELVAKLEG